MALLARYQVPLIEDDVYAELYFGDQAPAHAKAEDRHGLVLHVSSFSKSLAPGYRIGWVAGGRFTQKIQRLKLTTSLATTVPVQIALAEYLKHGGYDNHLRRLRRTFSLQEIAMVGAVERHFPAGTRLARPSGGYFLWVELPRSIDSLAVHRLALDQGISIAPGPIFSAKREYGHCLRLNYGHPWTPATEKAIAVLGQIIDSLLPR